MAEGSDEEHKHQYIITYAAKVSNLLCMYAILSTGAVISNLATTGDFLAVPV